MFLPLLQRIQLSLIWWDRFLRNIGICCPLLDTIFQQPPLIVYQPSKNLKDSLVHVFVFRRIILIPLRDYLALYQMVIIGVVIALSAKIH